MIKVNNIKEAVAYLREKEILTSNGKDQFILLDNKVYRYYDGNQFALPLKEFSELYKDTSFYLYEDVVTVDEEKDEAYYRYYKK